jgi:hypothetical protein
MTEPIVCIPKMLPRDSWITAAQTAIKINSSNCSHIEHLGLVEPSFPLTPDHLALMTKKRWNHISGVRLTVGFLDNPPTDLRALILLHMNAWSKTANVQFLETTTDPQVRITRTPGNGHWSYLGTDILADDLRGQPTMNLDSFTMNTPESEFHRVVRHETGHTMGFHHEHLRQELVALIDPEKAIKYYWDTQGWPEAVVRQQVLTPIEESSILGTPHADPNSIMCYQIPGLITKDGKPIIGGLDIDTLDYEFAAQLYPKSIISV